MPGADGPVDWPALEAMAQGLIERGVSTLAVVHFPAGCVAADPSGRTWRQGSVRVPRAHVRSTTGAGDAFAAGVILGLHEAGRRSAACGSARPPPRRACAARTRPTASGSADACLAEAERAGYRPTAVPAR